MALDQQALASGMVFSLAKLGSSLKAIPLDYEGHLALV
jgi:hypothetical protein